MKERNTESGRMLRECEVLATICGWWSIGQLGGEKAKKFIFRSIGTSFYSVQYGKYLLALGIQTTNIQQQRTNRKRRGEFVLSVVEAVSSLYLPVKIWTTQSRLWHRTMYCTVRDQFTLDQMNFHEKMVLNTYHLHIHCCQLC